MATTLFFQRNSGFLKTNVAAFKINPVHQFRKLSMSFFLSQNINYLRREWHLPQTSMLDTTFGTLCVMTDALIEVPYDYALIIPLLFS